MRLPGTRSALLGGFASFALIAPAMAAPAPTTPQNGSQSDFPMVVGQPYQIGGTTFVPSDSMNFDSVGYASVSSEGSGVSAAHHTLPVPSYAEVTDLASGRTILVRINRRGPMDGSHAIELSPGAAAQLGIAASGKAAVRVRRVNPPEAERALLRSGAPAPERMPTPKPLLDVLQRKLNPALAQRTLDSADEDAGPAKVQMAAATPKPVVATPKALPGSAKSAATSPAAKPPAIKTNAPDAPPKGYIPSVPAPGEKTPVKPVSKAPADPTPRPESAKKPETPAKPAPRPAEPAKPTGSFTIQAGAFTDKTRAQAVANKIGGTLSQAGKAWRVRVGPYAGHALAEAALAKVKSAGYSDARIQRAD